MTLSLRPGWWYKKGAMKRRLPFLILLFVMVLGVSCSKKEEQTTAPVSTADQGPPKPKPGDMVLIPAGEFTMGNDKDKFASPAHKVNLPAYYIDAYEVTYYQWIEFLTKTQYAAESQWERYFGVGKEEYPVANITLDDAKAYAQWAGKRIPTEAEWEKAARGTEGFLYPWGNTWDPTKSNCGEYGQANTVPVGQMYLDKSPYGVYDMMGNVQEWTSDVFKPYPGNKKDDPAYHISPPYYAVRGGSYVMWPSRGGGMFTYTRGAYVAKSQFGLGFRCAKDGEAPKTTSLERVTRQLALLTPDLDLKLN